MYIWMYKRTGATGATGVATIQIVGTNHLKPDCFLKDLERKEAEEKKNEKAKCEKKDRSGGTWYTDIKGTTEKTPEEDEAEEKR